MADIRDYKIFDLLIEKAMDEYSQKDRCNAMYFVALDLLFNIKGDKARECITDSFYLAKNGMTKGLDSGIDAIYIEKTSDTFIIHLMNYKCVGSFEKSKKSNFDGAETQKISAYLAEICNSNETTGDSYNPTLKKKTKEVCSILENEKYKIVVHLISNGQLPFEPCAEKLFRAGIESQFVSIEYNLLDCLAKRYYRGKKEIVDAKIRGEKDSLFKVVNDDSVTSDVCKINAQQLMKMVSSDHKLRNLSKLEDYSKLCSTQMIESAFDDNVRNFLSEKNKVNYVVINSAQEEPDSFYYYNNGITILCEKCIIADGKYPLITLKDLQIVNGGQTLHSLDIVMRRNFEKLKSINVLCRILAVGSDVKLHTSIAEYTNSQSSVGPRNIKALDKTQLQLEHEFKLLGYRYERKNDQYSGEKRSKMPRINNEKAAQILISFYGGEPEVAKNAKAKLFAEKYDEVFNNDVSAMKILIPWRYYWYIEAKRKEKIKLLNTVSAKELNHVKFTSYYFLYVYKKIIDKYWKSQHCNEEYNTISGCRYMYRLYTVANKILILVSIDEININTNFDFATYTKGVKMRKDIDKLFLKNEKNNYNSFEDHILGL